MKRVLTVRVAYADTDAAGIAWHGNYLRWFEMGRTELLRTGGVTYRELVERDIHLPVIEATCRYHRAAVYDDLVEVHCEIQEIKGVRLRIGYELRVEEELIASGHTTHAFTRKSGGVIRPPRDVIRHLSQVKAPAGAAAEREAEREREGS